MRKRFLLAALTLVLAICAGVVAFLACYRGGAEMECCRNHPMGSHPDGKALGWLRQEYHLSEAQFQQVAQLHADYAPRCAEMCQRIAAQRARLSTVIRAASSTSPEVLEALKQTAALEGECRAATLAHLYEVAAVMPPEEGRRYLATMSASIVAPGAPVQAGHSTPMCEMMHPQ